MNKFWKISTLIVISSMLLFSPMGTAYAGGNTPSLHSEKGFVTVGTSTSYTFPGSDTGQPGGGITPDSTYPMPGSGGTAIAEIGVMYNNVSLKGYGQSSISSDALGTFTLCAQVVYLKRNGSNVGSASYTCASYKPGGSSYSRQTGLVLGSPYGKTWTEETKHRIKSEVFGGDWQPTLDWGVTL